MRTKDVLRFYDGNAAEVARQLDITRAAVDHWGPLVPPIRARKLHEITSGALSFDPAAYAKVPRWAELAAFLSAGSGSERPVA